MIDVALGVTVSGVVTRVAPTELALDLTSTGREAERGLLVLLCLLAVLCRPALRG